MPDFTMPSLGADMESGTLLEWLVEPGQEIRRGDPIAVVDTDKAAIEVESFHDGVVEALLVQPGTRVQVGGPMARIASAPAGAAAVTVDTQPVTAAATAVTAEVAHELLASPPVRHHAAELGVDLAAVVGTGPRGRIRRQDVDAAAEAAPAVVAGPPPAPTAPAAARPPAPAAARHLTASAPAAGGRRRRVSPYARRLADELGVDLDRVAGTDGVVGAEDVRAAARAAATAPAPTSPMPAAAASEAPVPERPGPAVPAERVPPSHTPGRAAIGALMSRAKREIPHYYVATTVDLDALTTWLRRTNKERPVSGRIVPAAAILRATALAAREVPELNGFWRQDGFVPGEDVHLGVAVSVRGGALVAPAIRHAADLSLPDTMRALRDLVSRARSGRLTRAEMADPTLTVTDLGDQGVEEVIGVIYAPQVALLGVGRIVERPWAVDGLLGVHPVVRLTLSGDHRATDGSTGSRFLNAIDRLLQRPEEL